MIAKHTSSLSTKSNKRYSSSASFPQINPIAKGLVMVFVKAAYLVPYVRQFLEQAIVENSDDLNPGFEGGTLLSLYSGTGRQLDQALAFRAASVRSNKEQGHSFETVGVRSQYDWVSAGGLFAVQAILDNSDEDWITLGQEVTGPVTHASTQILVLMREEAKREDAGIMMFVTGVENSETTELPQLVDESIWVEPCEPDPGDLIAFSIDVVGVRHLNALGVGKQMCSIGVSAGRFRRRCTQYIAPDLQTRAMSALRAQGKKLAEIGSLLGVNKSTVMRRLDGLSYPRPGDPSGEDWLNRYLELLPNGSAEASDDDTDSATDADADAATDADEDDDFEDFGESNFEN